ncbi:MAG TPA: hypothetical protein VND91_06645 [Candidatus Saccharimonadia bacterium]|nr:hypothetical protein [Candidatus Saccharimonadia bacterium]
MKSLSKGLLALGLACAIDRAHAVTDLQAVHRDGQTFVTWSQDTSATRSYRVYRAAQPIDAATLPAAELLGSARPDSSANVRLNTITNPSGLGTQNQFRIAANEAPLTAAQGVFVHTVAAGATSWYAVTEVVNGVEALAIVPGESTLAAPVVESIGAPQPVFQRSMVSFGRTNDIYTHWVGDAGHAGYPAMANEASVPFNFALQRRGTAPPHPLVIRMHFKGGNFLSLPFGTNNANEWLLMVDDWLPNLRNRDTFWYGYHEGFALHGDGGPVPTSGSVPDYTARRVRWTFDWVLTQGAIDTNRVYMTGTSMGGIGSFFLAMTMPERIAAIYTQVPKLDFSFLGDPNPGSIWNAGQGQRAEADRLWGAVATNLPGSDGLGVYDRMNAGRLAEVFVARSMPVVIAFNGRNDIVVGWAEKIPFYEAMQANRHGGYFFWDTRTHGGAPGYTPEWSPQEAINPVNEFDGVNFLNLYRLDQSHPAFSRASIDQDPGNGLAGDGDPVGTINGHLVWDRATIVDTPTRWEVTIRLQNLTMQPVGGSPTTVPAPAQASVDVTPRRLQAFAPAPGREYDWVNLDAGSNVVQAGRVVADALGLVTVQGFTVATGGNRLVVSDGDPVFADGFED